MNHEQESPCLQPGEYVNRDDLAAAELNRQGLKKAQFVANPVMDNLNSTGKDLQLIPRGKDDRPSPRFSPPGSH